MSSQNRGRPLNILLICTDQERSWVDLPSALPLPAHEKLLAEGIGFENYHINVSPCGPSRSVIYTGQHTQHTGVYVNGRVGQKGVVTKSVTNQEIERNAGVE